MGGGATNLRIGLEAPETVGLVVAVEAITAAVAEPVVEVTRPGGRRRRFRLRHLHGQWCH